MSRPKPCVHIACFALVYAVLVCAPSRQAAAQRAWVETVAYSALGQAAAVYLHVVDFSSGDVAPVAQRLPGRRPLMQPVLFPSHNLALTATAGVRGVPYMEPSTERARYTVLQITPLRFVTEMLPPSENISLLRPVPVRNVGEDCIALAHAETGENKETTYSLAFYRLEGDEKDLAPWKIFESLPGEPLDVLGVGAISRSLAGYVLLNDARNGLAVMFLDFERGRAQAVPIPTLSNYAQVHGVSLLPVDTSGKSILLATTQQDVFPFAKSTLLLPCIFPQGKYGMPLVLRGVPTESESPWATLSPDTTAVATYDEDSGFGRITVFRWIEQETGIRLERVEEIPLSENAEHTLVAAAPTSDRLAYTLGPRLFWQKGVGGLPESKSFAETLRWLAWTQEGILAAEENRLHQLDPETGRIHSTLVFQTGCVEHVAILPPSLVPQDDADMDGLSASAEQSLGTSPSQFDSDNDGLPDGADPEPLVPTPQLDLPEQITLYEKAAGRQLRGLFLQTPCDPAYWEAGWDKEQMPWLVLYPTRGRTPAVIYLGIDPLRFRRETDAGAPVTITLQTQDFPMTATSYRHTYTVPVVVKAQAQPFRRILWVLPTNARSDVEAEFLRAVPELQDTLSAAPHLFTHTLWNRGSANTLDSYDVVILTAGAILDGAVLHAELAQFLRGGGGVLILAQALSSAEARVLDGWLAPFSIRVRGETPLHGVFTTTEESSILPAKMPLRVEGGVALYSSETFYSVPVQPDAEEAVLLVKTYGYGRIAALASPSMLTASENKASDVITPLTEWLAQSLRDVQDMDGDGLPDAVEDKRNPGQVDPGETHYLIADTDGDGVPDGLEDANLNGRVDPGETDPRNPDTDGDGYWDGADHTPYAPFESPGIDYLMPAQGPAEGNVAVNVVGRNFSPDSVFYFADVPALSQTVLSPTLAQVRTPPLTEHQKKRVALRVLARQGVFEAVLPEAFEVSEATGVYVHVQVDPPSLREQMTYSGLVRIRFEAPESAVVQRIFLLMVLDDSSTEWEDPVLSTAGVVSGMRLQSNVLANRLLVTLSGRWKHSAVGDLVRVPYRVTAADAQALTPHIQWEEAGAIAPWGGAYRVEVTGINKVPPADIQH